jgi:hypothetical protein
MPRCAGFVKSEAGVTGRCGVVTGAAIYPSIYPSPALAGAPGSG